MRHIIIGNNLNIWIKVALWYKFNLTGYLKAVLKSASKLIRN